MPRRLSFVSLAALVVGFAAVGDAAAGSEFRQCRLDLAHDVECASIPVQLDRSGAVPGILMLHVERVRATAKPARGAMFVLSGGPGEGVSASTDDYVRTLRPARATHDLILVDQRGTGVSGALSCPGEVELAETRADLDIEIAACAAALGPHLPLYTTSDVVDDLEEVRRALGIERIGLMGVSYGTRVALAYAERYPQNVERLVLDSVVPLAGPAPFGLNSIGAIPRVLRDVCGHDCRFTRDPVRDLARLVRKIERGPLKGTAVTSTGLRYPARMGRVDLLELLMAGDYLPLLRSYVPAAVHSALAGDPAPLLRLRQNVWGGGYDSSRAFSAALYLTTRCSESSEAWIAYAAPEERSAAARAYLDGLPAERFAPFDRVTALATSDLQLCRTWPSSGRTAARFDGPLPDVPALIVSGTADLRTPLEDAVALAAQLPQAQLLPVRGVGHAALFEGPKCVSAALERFMAGRSAGRCAQLPHVRAAFPAPDPRRPVTPLAAVLLTLDDVVQQLPLAPRAGGLRGGRYAFTFRGLSLERVSVLPGVTVSGQISSRYNLIARRVEFASGKLTVRLRGQRAGTLVLRGGRLSGTLAGRHVSRRVRLGLLALG